MSDEGEWVLGTGYWIMGSGGIFFINTVDSRWDQYFFCLLPTAYCLLPTIFFCPRENIVVNCLTLFFGNLANGGWENPEDELFTDATFFLGVLGNSGSYDREVFDRA